MHLIAVVVVAFVAGQAPAPAEPAATPAPVARRSVVVLDLDAEGVAPHEAALVSGLVVDALAKYEQLDVLQKADIQRMAAFEADKQMLGCSEASCLAEIAGALGAAYVVFGRVGILDGLILVQLNLFDAGAGKAVARQDLRVPKLRDVATAMPHAIGQLVQPLTGMEPPPPPVYEAEASPLVDVARWGGAGASGLGLVVSGVGAGVAGGAWLAMQNASAPSDQRNGAKALGAAMVVTSLVGVGLAVVGGTVFGLSFVGGV